MNIILFALYLILTTAGLLFLKAGAGGLGASISHSLLTINIDMYMIIGLICYVFSFIIFNLVLSRVNLSFIYPISAGLVNIAVIIASVLIFKEKVTTFGIMGMVIVIIGIVVMNIK